MAALLRVWSSLALGNQREMEEVGDVQECCSDGVSSMDGLGAHFIGRSGLARRWPKGWSGRRATHPCQA
jgi:hypothetical protein